jgi:glycosyltransferase involved in cell wall biosynthesis
MGHFSQIFHLFCIVGASIFDGVYFSHIIRCEFYMKRLLLILNTDLEAIVRKGELVPYYYNPSDYFDEIMVLGMQNLELPPETQPMFGRARLLYHYVGKPAPLRTLGYQPPLLQSWFQYAQEQLDDFTPGVIRIHGPGVNGLLAIHLKQQLNIPLICSTHGANDINRKLGLSGATSLLDRTRQLLYHLIITRVEKQVLAKVDLNIAVYHSIVLYLKRFGASNIRLIYNSVNQQIPVKQDYRLSSSPALLNVGIQTPGIKEPSAIIQALKQVDQARLDVVGNGIAHADLQRLVASLPYSERVQLLGFRPNQDIVQSLPNYDLYTFRSNAPEISKSVIEGLLAGLPVIVNRRQEQPVQEFEQGDFVYLVDDTPEAWATGINELLRDDQQREKLGRRGREYALETFLPEKMEFAQASVYEEIIF